MRPRSDQGSSCTDEDRSEETEDRALISAITFKFVHEDYNYTTIVLQSQALAFRWRVMVCKTTVTKHLMMSQQRYHDALEYRSMTVGNVVLAHKASVVG